jgi:hypothetical protein
MADAMVVWCIELERVLSESWFQWFVFEPVFTETRRERQ